MRRTNLAQTVASAAQAAAPAASGVISLAAVRIAGVETWGGFLAAMVLVNLVAQVAAFGSREHLLRAFSRDPSAIRPAWQRNVSARAWLLLLGPVLFLVAGWGPVTTALMVAWLVGVFVTRSHDPVIAYRRAFTFGLAVELLGTAVTTAAILALGGALTVEQLIATHAAVAVARAGFLAARLGVAGVPRRLPRLDIPELRASWRFFALTFSGAVQSRIDLYVVAALLPAAALGEYGVLTSFVGLGQSMAAALLAPIVPALYRLPRSRVVRVAVRTAAVGVPVTIAGTAAVWLGLGFLYGIELTPLTVAAAGVAMLPCFLYTPLVYLRFRDGREDAVIAASLLGLVLSLAGTIALAPNLGIGGAMLAAALGQLAIAGAHVVATGRGGWPAELGRVLDRAAAHRFAGALALLPALLVVIGGLAIVLARSFEGLYGQDAFAYIDYARGPLTTALARIEAPPWFYWPPGYPILVALAAAVTGLGDRAGQAVSLLAGGAIPALTALLARELLASEAPAVPSATRRLILPLLAGLAAAAAPQLWQSSVVGMADTSAAAAATAGAWAVCRYWRRGGTRWLAIGAGALAFALETRWIYGLVAVPLVALALVAFRRAARTRRPFESAREAAVAALAGVAVLLPAAVPMLAAIIAGGPLSFAADFAAYHWDPANALRSTIQNLDGELAYDQAGGAYYASQPVRRYWFGLLGLLALPGVLAVVRRPAVPVIAALLVWPALVLGFLAGGGYQNPRFFLAALPPVAILVAVGAGALWGWLPRVRPARNARVRAVTLTAFLAAVLMALASNAGYAATYTDAFVARQATDLAAIRSLAAQAPVDARLITLGATPVLRHDGRPDVVELYYLDETSAPALVADGRPTYLLVDMASMRAQWAAEAPGRAVRALEREPGLESIAAAGIWTLYRVGRAP